MFSFKNKIGVGLAGVAAGVVGIWYSSSQQHNKEREKERADPVG